LSLNCCAHTDITTGLNGQSITLNLGTPDNLVLRGNAFPVIVAQDGVNTTVAAARVSDGRVVGFNKVQHLCYSVSCKQQDNLTLDTRLDNAAHLLPNNL
jgi:hypothetical protein